MSDNVLERDGLVDWAGPAWLNRPAVWCDDHRRGLLLGAAALQIVLLLAMTALHAAPLLVGETIRLKVEPVDPRDLFRGDYVILSYAINRPPPKGIEGIEDSGSDGGFSTPREPEEQTVYVGLEKDAKGDYWRATKYSIHRPSSGTFIRGTYRSNRYGPGRISYGIESFYVPEGTGRGYEDAARHRQLTAEIALAPWGAAKLRKLIIE